MEVLKDLPKYNSYKKSTIDKYDKIIKDIINKSQAGDNLLNIIKKPDNVKFINDFTSDYTKKLYYVLINNLAQNNNLDSKDYYQKKVNELSDKLEYARGTNKNEKRQYTTWEKVYSIFDKIPTKKLEDKLTIGFYTRIYNENGDHWIFRNDPRTFKFGDNDTKYNWVTKNKDSFTIYLNDYKTKNRYGNQIIPIIDKDMIDLLDIYTENLKNGDYLFNDNNSSWTQKLGRITKKYLGLKLTSQIIREIYESHLQNSEKYQKLNLNRKRRLHEMLFHDISTALEYMKIGIN